MSARLGRYTHIQRMYRAVSHEVRTAIAQACETILVHRQLSDVFECAIDDSTRAWALPRLVTMAHDVQTTLTLQ
jgi:hypothetical protein